MLARPRSVALLCMSRGGGAAGGGAVVLDVAELEALLTRTFSIGLDVGRGREKVALVRLRLSKALLGAAETQAMAAEALAIERGVAAEQVAAAEGLAARPKRKRRATTRPGKGRWWAPDLVKRDFPAQGINRKPSRTDGVPVGGGQRDVVPRPESCLTTGVLADAGRPPRPARSTLSRRPRSRCRSSRLGNTRRQVRMWLARS
jgi:hypothetical protein